jgi:hypothetical protein
MSPLVDGRCENRLKTFAAPGRSLQSKDVSIQICGINHLQNGRPFAERLAWGNPKDLRNGSQSRYNIRCRVPFQDSHPGGCQGRLKTLLGGGELPLKLFALDLRIHPRDQFPGAEGLDQVFIRPSPDALQDGLFTGRPKVAPLARTPGMCPPALLLAVRTRQGLAS